MNLPTTLGFFECTLSMVWVRWTKQKAFDGGSSGPMSEAFFYDINFPIPRPLWWYSICWLFNEQTYLVSLGLIQGDKTNKQGVSTREVIFYGLGRAAFSLRVSCSEKNGLDSNQHKQTPNA